MQAFLQSNQAKSNVDLTSTKDLSRQEGMYFENFPNDSMTGKQVKQSDLAAPRGSVFKEERHLMQCGWVLHLVFCVLHGLHIRLLSL